VPQLPSPLSRIPFTRGPDDAAPDPHAERLHQVVVVGGGFGGLTAVRALRHAPVGITLVDRRNFHLFQPLLYQVASGWLSPAEIAAPLRPILRGQPNVEVLLGEVADVDLAARRVVLADGDSLAYDSLVLAPGSRVALPAALAESGVPGLKTLEDAVDIRRRVLLAFEAAERARRGDEPSRSAWLTFVVIGGGTTGVELAGVLAELARDVLRGDFRHFDPGRARIILVHGRDRVLPEFDPALSASAARDLARLRVEIVTDTRVAQVDESGVMLRSTADGTERRIEARTVLWAAGVRPVDLGERVCSGAGIEPVDGLVPVDATLALPGHPEVYVIGDLAAVTHNGEPLPGVAPVAMQGGRHVARAIRARLAGKPAPRFRYRDRGLLATIGRGAAVAQLGPLRFDGFLAWIIWIFVHLMYLVEFQSRVVVVLRWTWDFFLHQRGSRLITGVTGLGPGADRVAADAAVGRAGAPTTQSVVRARPAAGDAGRAGRRTPAGRRTGDRDRLRVGTLGRRR